MTTISIIIVTTIYHHTVTIIIYYYLGYFYYLFLANKITHDFEESLNPDNLKPLYSGLSETLCTFPPGFICFLF